MTAYPLRWAVRLVLAFAVLACAVASAKPKAKSKKRRAHPTAPMPAPARSLPAEAPDPAPAAAPDVGAATPPATAGAPASERSAATATDGKPTIVASPQPDLKPSTGNVIRKAPTLAMRPRASEIHGGFIDQMDCNACHTTDGWNVGSQAGKSGFDHDRTGFALRGAHVQTPCSGCHAAAGKPATTCEGCHDDPHQGRSSGTCAECHIATAWRDTNPLERHRRTRMPLTGRHATIDCIACHRRQSERQYSSTPTSCYACHRAEYHGDAHPRHDGRTGQPVFPRECGMCHQTSGWSPALRDPSAAVFSALRASDHDAFFILSTGSHRRFDCAACHVDPQRQQWVRCDSCHTDSAVRTQHKGAIAARTASACLSCHPRGAAR